MFLYVSTETEIVFQLVLTETFIVKSAVWLSLFIYCMKQSRCWEHLVKNQSFCCKWYFQEKHFQKTFKWKHRVSMICRCCFIKQSKQVKSSAQLYKQQKKTCLMLKRYLSNKDELQKVCENFQLICFLWFLSW